LWPVLWYDFECLVHERYPAAKSTPAYSAAKAAVSNFTQWDLTARGKSIMKHMHRARFGEPKDLFEAVLWR
jgi:hypothetical protein